MSIRIIRCPFKLSALAITLSLNITESQATTVTSPEAAVPPVNIDTVLNYGYAGILASSFLNVPGYGNATNPPTNQPGVSWGNYNFTWYYFKAARTNRNNKDSPSTLVIIPRQGAQHPSPVGSR